MIVLLTNTQANQPTHKQATKKRARCITFIRCSHASPPSSSPSTPPSSPPHYQHHTTSNCLHHRHSPSLLHLDVLLVLALQLKEPLLLVLVDLLHQLGRPHQLLVLALSLDLLLDLDGGLAVHLHTKSQKQLMPASAVRNKHWFQHFKHRFMTLSLDLLRDPDGGLTVHLHTKSQKQLTPASPGRNKHWFSILQAQVYDTLPPTSA